MDRDIGKVNPIIDALVIGAEFQAFLLSFFFYSVPGVQSLPSR